MIATIAGIVAPVFILAAIGFFWRRAGVEFHPGFVSRLVINLGAPALIFSGLTDLTADPATLATVFAAALVFSALLMAATALILRLAKTRIRDYLSPLVWGNWANMGIPICVYAFGEAGLSLALAFFAVGATAQMTIGIALMGADLKPAALVRTPIIWAVLLALLVITTGAGVPPIASRIIDLIAQMTIPLMLLSLGVSIADLKLAHIKTTAPLAVYRSLAAPLCGFATVGLLGLEGVSRGIVLVQASMPIAVISFMLAEQYDNRPRAAASLVLLTTLLSLLSIPAMLAVVLGS